MKKIGLLLLLFTGLVSGIYAQNLDPKKTVKEVSRSLTKFNLDNTKLDELESAKTLVTKLLDQGAADYSGEAWKLLGDIHAAYINMDMANAVLDPAYTPQFPEASAMAFEAYQKAVEMTDDKKIMKGALDGMSGSIQGLSSAGIELFKNQKYAEAYENFNKILSINKMLTDNGMDPALQPEDLNNQEYLAGLAALTGGMMDKAEIHYKNLQKNEYEDPSLYEGLFKIEAERDEAKALEILDQGRTKYPDDKNLLYAEINYYLQKGDIGQLEGKLEKAIEQDPENVSLYTTLGNVYDQTFQTKMKEGALEEAASYFDKAIETFNEALDIEPQNVSAIYSLGALYFNKAANKTQELQELSTDYSAAGVKKYDAKKAEIEKIFDQALPFFQKAEMVNPNDRNTLIALKEIYARKNDLEKSTEFKNRLEKIESGGTNESSFFDGM